MDASKQRQEVDCLQSQNKTQNKRFAQKSHVVTYRRYLVDSDAAAATCLGRRPKTFRGDVGRKRGGGRQDSGLALLGRRGAAVVIGCRRRCRQVAKCRLPRVSAGHYGRCSSPSETIAARGSKVRACWPVELLLLFVFSLRTRTVPCIKYQATAQRRPAPWLVTDLEIGENAAS